MRREGTVLKMWRDFKVFYDCQCEKQVYYGSLYKNNSATIVTKIQSL